MGDLKTLLGSMTDEEKFELRVSLLSLQYVEQIQKRMEKKGISKKQLAYELDISLSQLSKYFWGGLILSLPLLCRIEKILDCKFRVEAEDKYVSHL